MRVILAGYNIDADLLAELKALLGEAGKTFKDREDIKDARSKEDLKKLQDFFSRAMLTPESLSAAYARISRDPRPVPELRHLALGEVEKARKSNKHIVFGMGHFSVAEHAVFNFDVLGVSRLAVEALENHRLSSFTEKSQRYIPLEGGYIHPPEFQGRYLELFQKLAEKEKSVYLSSYPLLKQYFFASRKDDFPLESRDIAEKALMENVPLRAKLKEKGLPADQITRIVDLINSIDGWAKEDARYALGLATEAQLGCTVNARNLEYVVRTFRYHPLAEVRELGRQLFLKAREIAPSLIICSDPEEFEKTFHRPLKDTWFEKGKESMHAAAAEAIQRFGPHGEESPGRETEEVRLIASDPEGDEKILTAMLQSASSLDATRCRAIIRHMGESERLQFFRACLSELSEFDRLPRAFEETLFTYEIVMSASCFAQMKRHRMMTLLPQAYDPALGHTLPESVLDAGLEKQFTALFDESASVFLMLRKEHPDAAVYALTNACRRRARISVNARELYHISRLREDRHAQWDIRKISEQMLGLAKKAAPLTFLLACGKDRFLEHKKSVYRDG